MSDLNYVLRWAAGLNAPPPSSPEFDEESLLDLTDRHALTGRLLKRLEDGNGAWASPALRRRLHQRFREIRATLISHTEAVREIAFRQPDPADVIVIKGISTYLLTDASHTMRCGDDVDVVCADGEQIPGVLAELGYRQTRGGFLHEIGEFTRGDTEIDLHAFFPVYRYDVAWSEADLDPAQHPDTWRQRPAQPGLCRITHEALRAGARPGRRAPGVFVPDPCLLAIILCAHSFMNFTNLWSISHRRKPYVRLGELADVWDLVHAEDFNTARFWALAHEHQALDAIDWAWSMMARLLGNAPVPRPPSLGGPIRTSFPRCLWWHFWVDVPFSTDPLVEPNWLDMASLVGHLGAKTLDAVGGRVGPVVIGDDADGSHALRMIRLTPARAPTQWTLDVSHRADQCVVDIGLPARPAAATERVRVDFGHQATEWSSHVGSGASSAVGTHAEPQLRPDGDRRRLRLRYPWNDVSSGNRLDLLIGVTGHDDTGHPVHGEMVALSARF